MPKISILVSARKNSKYLAKFLCGLVTRTDKNNVEVLVMLNAEDTWNDEIVQLFSKAGNIFFYREDYRLGRAGLHKYFNMLYSQSIGDWIVYFCEDHHIIFEKWDEYVLKQCEKLDPRKPYCLVPRFDNVGTMNHIVSRGFVEAMGGELGKNGWIDSYINGVLAKIPKENVILLQEKTFHDFTHDVPSPMSDEHMKSDNPQNGHLLPKFDSQEVQQMIEKDAELINKKISNAII